jgi:hypothetical protein
MRRIEIQEPQHQRVAAVVEPHHELAARPEFDARIHDDALDLHRLAFPRIDNADELRLVLVAQRQVQRQVDVAPQAELVHRPRRSGGFGAGGCAGWGFRVGARSDCGHGTILPSR